MEVDLGALDYGILLAAFLMVEVAQEGFEDVVHYLLIAREVQEAVFSGAILLRQHIGMEHLADVEDKPVEAVVAVEPNVFEGATGDVDDGDFREAEKSTAEVFPDGLVHILVPEEAVHRCVDNLVEQDVAREVVKGADGLAFTVPVPLDGLGEFQFPFDTCYSLLVGTVFLCYTPLEEDIGTFCEQA